MEEVYHQRVEELKNRMSDAGADLTVLFPGPNMTYFSGVEAEPSERHFLLLIPSEGDPYFMAPDLFEQEVDSSGFDVSFWEDSDNPKDVLSGILDRIDVVPESRVLLDDRMWEKFSQDIRELTDTEYGLASEVVKEMRMVKNENEIENIREASKIVDRVVEDVREKGVVGMTERGLKDFIEEKMREYGGEGPSFSTIVAAGSNGSKPHHEPTEREIQSGEPVVLDFGCWKDNYPSDQTRTLVFGKEPSDKFKEVFGTVLEAQRKAVEKVRPGVKAGEVDQAAREVIEEAGYGEEFVHRTGHGVGLEVHEHPEIKKDGKQVLEGNMVFSVEPGIYIKEEFGVRIEDLVQVTEDGCERLNGTRRGWETGK